MNGLIKTIAADRITKLGTLVPFGVLLVTLLYLLFIYQQLPPFLPLFNQMAWGEPRLAEKVFVFLPLLIAGIILLSNTIIAGSLYQKVPLLARMISITSFLVSSVTVIFLFRITQLLL